MLLVTLLLPYTNPIIAQAKGFNKLYGEVVVSRSVQPLGHTFFTYSEMSDALWNYIKLIKIDAGGLVIDTFSFRLDSVHLGISNHVSLTSTSDSGLICSFYYYKPSGIKVNGLLKLDNNLNVKWHNNVFEDTNRRGLYQITEVSDKGFVCTGFAYLPASNRYETFLVKTDSLGNKEWEKRYDTNVPQYSQYGIFVYECPNASGYLISNRHEILTSGPNNDVKLIRTDIQGNVLWEKRCGKHNGSEGYGSVGYVNDSTFILYYSEYVDTIHENYQGVLIPEVRASPIFAKVDDKSGNIKSVSSISIPTISLTSTNSFFKDGNFYGVGYFLNLKSLSSIPIDGYYSYIICVDENLKFKWYRHYNSIEGQTNKANDSWLIDIKHTLDGGIVAAGYTFKDDTTGTGRFGFHGWMFKTDSIGCLESTCGGDIHLKEDLVDEGNGFQVYPNPSSSFFNVLSTDILEGEAMLYDMRGAALSSAPVKDGKARLIVGNLPKGIYVIRVLSEYRSFSKQVEVY